MNEDFSMAELLPRREAELGRKLTPDETAQLQKISDDNARLNEELAKVVADRDAKQSEVGHAESRS